MKYCSLWANLDNTITRLGFHFNTTILSPPPPPPPTLLCKVAKTRHIYKCSSLIMQVYEVLTLQASLKIYTTLVLQPSTLISYKNPTI